MITVTDSALDAHDTERGEGPISGPRSGRTTEIMRLRNRIETLDRELIDLSRHGQCAAPPETGTCAS